MNVTPIAMPAVPRLPNWPRTRLRYVGTFPFPLHVPKKSHIYMVLKAIVIALRAVSAGEDALLAGALIYLVLRNGLPKYQKSVVVFMCTSWSNPVELTYPPFWQIQADGGSYPRHHGQHWIMDRPGGAHRTHPSTFQLYPVRATLWRLPLHVLGRQVPTRPSIHSRRVPPLLFILQQSPSQSQRERLCQGSNDSCRKR